MTLQISAQAGAVSKLIVTGMAVSAFLSEGVSETRFHQKLKSGGKPKIAIIGNSTSQQWNQNACNTTSYVTWPGRLKEALAKVGAHTFETTTCAGRHSHNFLKGTDGFTKGLAWVISQKADAVIIEFAPGADCVGRFNITVAQSKSFHNEIIDKLLASNGDMEIFLWTGARSYGAKWIDRTSREASKETQPDYAAMYVDLAKTRNNVYAIDTYKEFRRIHDEEGLAAYKTYMKDDNHTNDKGATQVIIPEILRTMKEAGNTPTEAGSRAHAAQSFSARPGMRAVPSSPFLPIPAGATGVEVYSMKGRLLLRENRMGDASQDRSLAIPAGLETQGIVCIKYLTE